MKKLILASGSPRRRMLLENRGFELTVVKPSFDEDSVTETDPIRLVRLLAVGKNKAVSSLYPDRTVLAADTVVCINGKILGKPQNRGQAREMLGMLSGAVHSVYTGVCISLNGNDVCFFERTDVEFYRLGHTQIEKYIDSGSPFDKAGGYGIQDEAGMGFIKSIGGELSNVIGLPMERTVSEIIRLQGDIK